MKAPRMFAALAAALTAALLSLAGASLVIAGQPDGKGIDNQGSNGNGNAYGKVNQQPAAAAPQAQPQSAGEQPKQDRGKSEQNSQKQSGGESVPDAPRHESTAQAPKHQPTGPAPKQQTATTQAPAVTNGGGSQSTAISGPGNSGQGCDGTHHSDTGHGANQGGPYDNTCDGSPSGNGNGNATGKPCAGCVGNADDKNPKGQMPTGSDHNAGYECDRNHGIGRSNPAHTGCTTTEQPPAEQPPAGGNGCPQLSGALSQAAVVALKVAAAAHPEIEKLSELAGTKVASGCGHEDNGNGAAGGNTPEQPVTLQSEKPAVTEAPATTPAPGQQAVLGETVRGTSRPAATPKSTLSARTSAPAPAPAAASAPAVPQRPVHAGNQGGSLPFTGTDAILLLFLGCLMLLGGIAIQRVLARD